MHLVGQKRKESNNNCCAGKDDGNRSYSGRIMVRMRFLLLKIKMFAMLLIHPDEKQKAKNKWAAPHCAVLHFARDYLLLPEEKATKSQLTIWKGGPVKETRVSQST